MVAKACRCGGTRIDGKCDRCKPVRTGGGQWHAMYKLQRWVNGRLNWLASNPLCVECERQGTITAATVVDHIIPHKGDWSLFYDVSNWQSLCESCHAKKTRAES